MWEYLTRMKHSSISLDWTSKGHGYFSFQAWKGASLPNDKSFRPCQQSAVRGLKGDTTPRRKLAWKLRKCADISISSSLAGNWGHLTRVRHSSCRSSATHTRTRRRTRECIVTAIPTAALQLRALHMIGVFYNLIGVSIIDWTLTWTVQELQGLGGGGGGGGGEGGSLRHVFEFGWRKSSLPNKITHFEAGFCCYYYLSLLYSAILHSRADSLRWHVILHEWMASLFFFFSLSLFLL